MSKLYLGTKEITPVLGTKGPKYYIEKRNANGVLENTNIKIDLTGISDLGHFALYGAFYRNTTISGPAFIGSGSLKTISGNTALGNAFLQTQITDTALSSLERITNTAAMNGTFSGCGLLSSPGLDSLQEVSSTNGMSSCFSNCRGMVNIEFPELQIVSGTNGLYQVLLGCSNLVSVSFPKLHTITGSSALTQALMSCTKLEHVYFNALTTTSFGSIKNQFGSMLQATGTTVTHTLHFPSNLEPTIQGLQGYPLFGGTAGSVVLAFDLPSTGA